MVYRRGANDLQLHNQKEEDWTMMRSCTGRSNVGRSADQTELSSWKIV